ncbi:hypothetical protein PF004_g32136, partial [Phytophthora fragariae]
GRRRRAAPGRWTTTGGKDAAALLRGGLVLQAAGVRGNTNKRVEARETTAFGPATVTHRAASCVKGLICAGGSNGIAEDGRGEKLSLNALRQ